MKKGTIVKLVRSYGAEWGRIQPEGEDRAIFFNTSSLPEDTDFAALVLGTPVTFEEEKDRANGTHAVRVELGTPPAVEASSAAPTIAGAAQ